MNEAENQKSQKDPSESQNGAEEPRFHVALDAKGLHCPEPLMLLRNKMMDMRPGEVIKVVTTDPSTSWDFPNFCKFLHHEMVHQEQHVDLFQYWIKKGK